MIFPIERDGLAHPQAPKIIGQKIYNFWILLQHFWWTLSSLICLSDSCPRVKKKILKEIMYFQDMATR